MTGPPPAGDAPTPAPYAAAKPIEGRAIAALIVGLVSPFGAVFYVLPGLIMGAVAIFLGLTARSRIKRSGGVLGGGGMALAGWILGIVGIGISLILGLFLFGMFMADIGSNGKGG